MPFEWLRTRWWTLRHPEPEHKQEAPQAYLPTTYTITITAELSETVRPTIENFLCDMAHVIRPLVMSMDQNAQVTVERQRIEYPYPADVLDEVRAWREGAR